MKEDIENTEIALAFLLPQRNSERTISLNDVATFIQAKVSYKYLEFDRQVMSIAFASTSNPNRTS